MASQEEPKTLKEYYTPKIFANPSPIKLPEVTAQQFCINTNILQLVPSFHGLSNQNPYHHLKAFLSICSTFKLQNVSDDAIKLRLFPFSLRDKAKVRFDSLPINSITTWADMESTFLKKYFPIGKTNQLRKAITNFSQNDGETFHDTWERLKDLTRQCPHHKVPKWQLVQIFYDGLNQQDHQLVDGSTGSTIMMKNEDEAWELFQNRSENSQQYAQTNRLNHPLAKKSGIFEVNAYSGLQTQMDTLSHKLDLLLAQKAVPIYATCPV